VKDVKTLPVSAAHRAILRKPEKGRLLILSFGLILTVFISLLYVYQPTFLRFIDNKLYDTLLRSTRNSETSGLPVIVDLDEKSLAKFGQWPWPRYRVALLLEKIKQLGPLSIGLDMVFAEADRTSLGLLQEDILRDLNINIEFSGLPREFMDNDRVLAKTLSQGPFVLGYKFLLEDEEQVPNTCLLHPLNVFMLKPRNLAKNPNPLFSARDVVCNLKMLSEAVPSSGFFNTIFDFDGVLRRSPLIIEYNGKFYPSLAMATFIRAFAVRQVSLKITSDGVESLRLGKTIIPLDKKGNLLIHYRDKGKTFDYISAGAILSDLVPRERIKGKIIFLGTSAAGLKESCVTPLDTLFPGVEVHATIADNISKKDFLSRPKWIPGLELLLVLVSGILSTLLLGLTGAVWSLPVLGLSVVTLWQGTEWAFQQKGIFVSYLLPLITLGINFSFLTLVKYWIEERKIKERTKELALTQDVTIQSLAALAETRDPETGGHIRRTQHYVKILAQHLMDHPKFKDFLDEESIELLFKSAPLHDVGKVGVRDHILLKPARLIPEEFEIMKEHPVFGRDTIEVAERQLGSNSFLQIAREIAYCHQEKWDGTGYPQGLKWNEIPISARLMAVADVYDALISKRIYKPPIPHEEAVRIMAEGSGTHFDPDVLEAFLELQDEFRQIALKSSTLTETDPFVLIEPDPLYARLFVR